MKLVASLLSEVQLFDKNANILITSSFSFEDRKFESYKHRSSGVINLAKILKRTLQEGLPDFETQLHVRKKVSLVENLEDATCG